MERVKARVRKSERNLERMRMGLMMRVREKRWGGKKTSQ